MQVFDMGSTSDDGSWAFCDDENEIARLAMQSHEEDIRTIGHAAIDVAPEL